MQPADLVDAPQVKVVHRAAQVVAQEDGQHARREQLPALHEAHVQLRQPALQIFFFVVRIAQRPVAYVGEHGVEVLVAQLCGHRWRHGKQHFPVDPG